MITIIVLAAGMSERFPGNKLLIPFGNKKEPLIRIVVKSALKSKVDKVLVVVGHEKEKIIANLSDLPRVIFIENNNYIEGGMSSSVKIGLRSCLENEAVLITPADIPYLSNLVINGLIDYFQSNPNTKLIVPRVNNFKSHPILISKNLFNETLTINEESRGLKKITNKYRNDIVFLDFESIPIQKDIDTEDDLNFFK